MSGYDINKIKEYIPHRYPFLFVDRVISVEGPEEGSRQGRKAVAIKNVSVNEPFFNGHFPEMPIMPGVLLIEALAQVGALACFRESDGDVEKKILIAKVNHARFRRPIVPGDQVIMEAEVAKVRGKLITIKAHGTVDGELAVETEVLAHVDIGE